MSLPVFTVDHNMSKYDNICYSYLWFNFDVYFLSCFRNNIVFSKQFYLTIALLRTNCFNSKECMSEMLIL